MILHELKSARALLVRLRHHVYETRDEWPGVAAVEACTRSEEEPLTRHAHQVAGIERSGMTSPDLIEGLRAAIRAVLGCDSRWLHSVQVFTSHGNQMWSGAVEVFSLRGHRSAERAYAWRRHDGPGDRVVVHEPPIDGALAAVRSVESIAPTQ